MCFLVWFLYAPVVGAFRSYFADMPFPRCRPFLTLYIVLIRCDDVQMMCNNLADCCGACGDELVVVLSGCTPGDGGTCKISTCGTGAAPEEPPAEEPQEPEETEPEESEPEDEEPGSSCSTAISAAGLVAISFFAAMVNGV